jgi:hypothetical protein
MRGSSFAALVLLVLIVVVAVLALSGSLPGHHRVSVSEAPQPASHSP